MVIVTHSDRGPPNCFAFDFRVRHACYIGNSIMPDRHCCAWYDDYHMTSTDCGEWSASPNV